MRAELVQLKTEIALTRMKAETAALRQQASGPGS
jgi:hypothetical protein